MTYPLSIRHLTAAYDREPVLCDVNLELPEGVLAAIVGPNGAGKTTLMKTMLGLMKPLSGQVHFWGEPLKSLRKRIAYVPQSSSVDWDFPATVLDVTTMGRYRHLGWCRRVGKSEKRLAMEALEQLGMSDYAGRQISQLSGGQQQRVFLARALLQEADLYCMDEPFKGIDAQTEQCMLALFQDLKAQGKTLLVVHHDLHTVKAYFDWVALIHRELIGAGAVEDVFTPEAISATYGGLTLGGAC